MQVTVGALEQLKPTDVTQLKTVQPHAGLYKTNRFGLDAGNNALSGSASALRRQLLLQSGTAFAALSTPRAASLLSLLLLRHIQPAHASGASALHASDATATQSCSTAEPACIAKQCCDKFAALATFLGSVPAAASVSNAAREAAAACNAYARWASTAPAGVAAAVPQSAIPSAAAAATAALARLRAALSAVSHPTDTLTNIHDSSAAGALLELEPALWAAVCARANAAEALADCAREADAAVAGAVAEAAGAQTGTGTAGAVWGRVAAALPRPVLDTAEALAAAALGEVDEEAVAVATEAVEAAQQRR